MIPDKVIIGYLLILLVLPLIGLAARFLRRKRTQPFSFSFWFFWGNGIVVNLMMLVSHHMNFYHSHSIFVLSIIFGWIAVSVWFLWRSIEKADQKEIAAGRVPKIYNDWAKPDKP